jgi:hypothetical protein
MTQRLNYDKRTRVVNATAAGVTAINGTGIDMQDFENVTFEVAMGALTATQVTSIKAQGSNDNGAVDPYADITGAATANAADADSNKLLLLEVNRPQKRWIRVVVNRATANAVIDGGIAIQSGPKKAPVTQDATTVSQAKTVVGV